ncbi:MAG: ion transporter [Candidatus Omnitrophica bacterium]|nr:ion transporter [Candidatus Omnitrophota bacterium]
MGWRDELRIVVDESRTHFGRAFDVIVFVTVALSVVVVILESIHSVASVYGPLLRNLEWAITIWFTIEYLLRIVTARNPFRYIFSFYGIVDLLAVMPSYMSLFVAGSQSLMVFRAFRFLRIFRVFKLTRFVNEASVLITALKSSRQKITVFMCAVLAVALVMGTIMYVIEGENGGFDSIPMGIYWAIVTMTTVGYGDMTPHSALGKVLASVLMIIGYSILAIPTGIITVEIAQAARAGTAVKSCSGCRRTMTIEDALYCCYCSQKL